ncbi:hypothetical protein ACFE04_023273 [Oxalis oulophora]
MEESNPETSQSNDDVSNSSNSSSSSSNRIDAMAKGLSSMLSSVLNEFDSKAQDTLNSQDQLALALDRLTRELDQLLEDAPLPFIMQHAAKISSVRKRVSSLNSVLKVIQRRVDNIDRTLSMGMRHGICSKLCTLSILFSLFPALLFQPNNVLETENFEFILQKMLQRNFPDKSNLDPYYSDTRVEQILLSDLLDFYLCCDPSSDCLKSLRPLTRKNEEFLL